MQRSPTSFDIDLDAVRAFLAGKSTEDDDEDEV